MLLMARNRDRPQRLRELNAHFLKSALVSLIFLGLLLIILVLLRMISSTVVIVVLFPGLSLQTISPINLMRQRQNCLSNKEKYIQFKTQNFTHLRLPLFPSDQFQRSCFFCGFYFFAVWSSSWFHHPQSIDLTGK